MPHLVVHQTVQPLFYIVAYLKTKIETDRNKVTEEGNKKREESLNITKNSEKAFAKQISVLKNLKENTQAGSAQWNIYNNTIKILETSLAALTGKLKDVKKALRIRNISDANRKHSPLLKHRNSVEIDTGKLNKQAMLKKMSKHVEKMLLKKYGN